MKPLPEELDEKIGKRNVIAGIAEIEHEKTTSRLVLSVRGHGEKNTARGKPTLDSLLYTNWRGPRARASWKQGGLPGNLSKSFEICVVGWTPLELRGSLNELFFVVVSEKPPCCGRPYTDTTPPTC